MDSEIFNYNGKEISIEDLNKLPLAVAIVCRRRPTNKNWNKRKSRANNKW